MSDIKSKMPDLNEITSMAGKLFRDVKKSITEIIADYKNNHPATEIEEENIEAAATESKTEESGSKEPETQIKDETKNSDTA